ncbi:MAG: tyrosine-type recombinase/integrase [Pirellulaceae bacterium]
MLDADVATLISKPRRDSLVAWFELYLGTEAGPPESNTFKAKKRDLQAFVDYLHTSSGTDHPDQWTKSLTESFLRYLENREGLAATSINRVLATIKHVAGWIHLRRPFLVGNPCARVHSFDVDEPEWGGLPDLAVNRLKSAAEQLCHISARASQQPLRDQAMFLALLHTALRGSELLSLDLKQYKDDAFHNIQRKGKKVTRKLRVPKPARDAINTYIEQVRGKAAGPLFQSKTGRRLAVQNVDDTLKKIAHQANATLPAKQHLRLSAHMLRHTCLRKAAEKDIRYAMNLSGHTSSQYIWRYTEPSASEFDEAMEALYD